jgi:hypothetical protein
MLKITIVETKNVRRIILEGALVQPWVRELKETWASAAGRSPRAGLAVDLSNVTTISKEGEEVLAELMREGAKFRCGGCVLTRYLLRQLALKCRSESAGVKHLSLRE